jgi:hypothetical protein
MAENIQDAKSELAWLRFHDFIKRELEKIGREPWVTVYEQHRTETENDAFFCALMPLEGVSEALKDPSWDLRIGAGGPGCMNFCISGTERTEYFRYGNNQGLEPLVLCRSFLGGQQSTIEIAEEFRLFHNLLHDDRNGRYVKFDGNGDEEDVVLVLDNQVRIRLKHLKQFLTIKDMALAVFFDRARFSALAMEDLGLEHESNSVANKDHCYLASIADFRHAGLRKEKKITIGQLLGKKIVLGGRKEQSDFWPYDDKKKEFAEFIMGSDEDGNDLVYTSDPEALANYFGKNPGAPHYLTPVHFRPEVLDKYFSNPEKFSVEDGYLRCGGLWGLQMDNNNDKYVVVFLGDLGRDLHYSEQLYWKSFNIQPQGPISQVQWKRGFLAEFADPDKVDLKFKSVLSQFREKWRNRFGWDLLQPFSEKDMHYEKALHLPSKEDHAEFDPQVLALTKLLIDSLNEVEIEKALPNSSLGMKGISKLAEFLNVNGVQGYETHVRFLRDLQDLRSTGVGHRKGKNYEKAARAFDLDGHGLVKGFAVILSEAIRMLKFLESELLAPDLPLQEDG